MKKTPKTIALMLTLSLLATSGCNIVSKTETSAPDTSETETTTTVTETTTTTTEEPATTTTTTESKETGSSSRAKTENGSSLPKELLIISPRPATRSIMLTNTRLNVSISLIPTSRRIHYSNSINGITTNTIVRKY